MNRREGYQENFLTKWHSIYIRGFMVLSSYFCTYAIVPGADKSWRMHPQTAGQEHKFIHI